MITLSLQEIEKILQKTENATRPSLKAEELEILIHGTSIDTRTLTPGNLFVAIPGEQFDGHAFVALACEKNAAAALVSRKVAVPIPQIVVKDTITALGELAAQWRNRFSIPLIGITGSNGKTTLKNMLASILRAASPNGSPDAVLATLGNLNNNIGAPLTLLRLSPKHLFGVIEMGMNHFGEIAYLTQLTQPTVAIITNAAESHLEGLKTVAGVAQAKGEIFLGLQPGGTAVLNRDDAFFPYWRDLLGAKDYVTFGMKNAADIGASMSTQKCVLIRTPLGNIEVNLPLVGTHNIMNALAATAAALALNIDLATVKQGLENVTAASGRMRQYFLNNGLHLIDDTYNANPFSLQVALDTLTTFDGTKILVLGDMKELGTDARQKHTLAGQHIRAANIDYLFTLGDLSAATTAAFGKNAYHFTEREQLITALKPYLKENVNLLIKGSRSMKMEEIVIEIVPQDQFEHAH